MKIEQAIIRMNYLLLLGLLVPLSGCMQMSESETDASAGLNGGFEFSRNGLPVNWLMYSPRTVPNAEFKIELDNIDFKEGTQSLRFDVTKCSTTGGWHSPGFTNEFFEVGKYEGEGSYKLSFWIKNSGAKYKISAGGVAYKEGEMKVLITNNKETNDWKFLEYKINVGTESHLRMELNILEPGTFWIDDIRIEQI